MGWLLANKLQAGLLQYMDACTSAWNYQGRDMDLPQYQLDLISFAACKLSCAWAWQPDSTHHAKRAFFRHFAVQHKSSMCSRSQITVSSVADERSSIHTNQLSRSSMMVLLHNNTRHSFELLIVWATFRRTAATYSQQCARECLATFFDPKP